MWVHSEKGVIYKPRREASPEVNPEGILILDFQPTELWENKFLCLRHPACGILLGQPEQTNTYYLSPQFFL